MKFSWETMSNSQQQNDLIKTKIYNKTFLNCPKIASEIETKTVGITSSSFETVGNARDQIICDVGKYSATTSTNFSSSADSGVNINDNDETLLPPTAPPANPDSLSSTSLALSTKANSSDSQTGYQKNNKSTAEGDSENNCKTIRGNKNNNFNIESGNRGVDISSENLKGKLINDSGNGDDKHQFQPKQNPTEAENVSREETSKDNINKRSSGRNDFNNVQQRRASISSSLSTSSSVASSYDNNTTSGAHPNNGSPIVSIRSINSIIITSDTDSENDTDVNSDIVNSEEDYVIKKLGTQVTYSPNDPNTLNINSGHTVLNQKVIAGDSGVPPSPLEALAAIGDSIGAAQALGATPSLLPPAQRPQIGSIALSNSTDVTFGDKHFYEGPVTIQQFLINGRDKWKEANGEDKPAFPNENTETFTNNAKDIISHTEKPSKVYEYILKRKKLIIPGVLVFTALLILATVLGSKALNDGKSKLLHGNSEESRTIIPINSTIDANNNIHVDENQECEGNGTLCLIDRDVWQAHAQKGSLEKQVLPLHRVIISHTASEPCDSITVCANHIRVIQEFHMDSLGWNDIGYNFLISSDGRVYVGRGWDFVGAHTKGYNYDSVGITFIGTYNSTPPTEVQLKACLSLLEEGLRLKKLTPDYRLYGARQLGSTQSPGDMLYNEIKLWPQWSPSINLT